MPIIKELIHRDVCQIRTKGETLIVSFTRDNQRNVAVGGSGAALTLSAEELQDLIAWLQPPPPKSPVSRLTLAEERLFQFLVSPHDPEAASPSLDCLIKEVRKERAK